MVRGLKFWLMVVILAGMTPLVQAGLRNGNHLYESTFNYHIMKPEGWELRETNDPGGEDGDRVGKNWLITNAKIVDPNKASSVNTIFYERFVKADNSSVISLDDLEQEIKRRHPQATWDEINKYVYPGNEKHDKHIAGFFSDSSPCVSNGDSNHKCQTLYFWAGPATIDGESRALVIRTDLVRYTDDPEGTLLVEYIVRSIDTAFAPITISTIDVQKEVNGITVDTKEDTLRVGDRACLRIFVNDLLHGFNKEGLKKIKLLGEQPDFSFKEILWIPENPTNSEGGHFKVCYLVRTSFGSTDFQIEELEISNLRGDELSCELDEEDGFGCEGSPRPDKLPDVKVANSDPDKFGPRLTQFQMRGSILDVSADDASGILFAEVTLANERSLIIYGDDWKNGTASIDLAQAASPNTPNKVMSLVVFDKNGFRTSLTIPPNVPAPTKYRIESDGRAIEEGFSIWIFHVRNAL
jgi:hypothetical protein